MGFRSKKTHLLYSDRPIGRFRMRFVALFAWLALGFLFIANAVRAAGTPPTACGGAGKAPCPLQSWMREELARPYAARRFDQVALNTAALIRLNPSPEEWRDWETFAQQAGRAALAHDEEHLLQACTRCHRTYRREYIEKFRQRALSPKQNAL